MGDFASARRAAGASSHPPTCVAAPACGDPTSGSDGPRCAHRPACSSSVDHRFHSSVGRRNHATRMRCSARLDDLGNASNDNAARVVGVAVFKQEAHPRILSEVTAFATARSPARFAADHGHTTSPSCGWPSGPGWWPAFRVRLELTKSISASDMTMSRCLVPMASVCQRGSAGSVVANLCDAFAVPSLKMNIVCYRVSGGRHRPPASAVRATSQWLPEEAPHDDRSVGRVQPVPRYGSSFRTGRMDVCDV